MKTLKTTNTRKIVRDPEKKRRPSANKLQFMLKTGYSTEPEVNPQELHMYIYSQPMAKAEKSLKPHYHQKKKEETNIIDYYSYYNYYIIIIINK